MNILYLSAAKDVGGGNRSLLALCRGMREKSVKTLVAIPAPGDMSLACEAEDVPWIINAYRQPTWQRPWSFWRSHRDWTKVIRQFQPGIIHANELMPARSIILSASRINVPVVCHVRYPPKPAFVRWVFRRLPKPSVFIFNSKSLAEEVGPQVRDACPDSEQVVVYNAVDMDQFHPGNNSNDRARVGIVANLIPVKGHRDFLQMARHLKDRGLLCEYLLIGEDIHQTGYRSELEQLTNELGLDTDVHFLGHRSDVADLIRSLDIVVCTSHVEPFGRCVMEAMACEKPVVSTNVGGLPEVVGTDGKAGVLVEACAPERLAEALHGLLRDSDLRAAMGREGRRRVEAMFSLEAHSRQMLRIYEGLLAGGRSSVESRGV